MMPRQKVQLVYEKCCCHLIFLEIKKDVVIAQLAKEPAHNSDTC